MTQLRLGIEVPEIGAPAPRRREPAVWVHRLQIVRELRQGSEYVIRNVELRRGLNIVWAPPQAEHATRLYENGMTGHTAGKTSFCRLLRYALGDRHFGNEETRNSVRVKLPHAWLLAEVFVGGRPWAVARPLGRTGKAFCIPDADVGALVTGEGSGAFSNYLDAITQATTARLPAKRFPGSEEEITWGHLLPWLTRDQECRFADFAVWRHPASASDAPQLAAEERHFLMRSTLALVSDAERDEQDRNAALLARKKVLNERIPVLGHQALVDEQRLGEMLGTAGLQASGLMEDTLHQQLSERRTRLEEQRAEFLARDPRIAAQSNRELSAVAVAVARRDLEELEDRLEDHRITLNVLQAEHEGREQRQLLEGWEPGRNYCNVPMELAERAGCPLYSPRPINFFAAQGERNLQDHRVSAEKTIMALEQQLTNKRGAVAYAEEEYAKASRDLTRIQTEFDGVLTRLAEEDYGLREVERLLTRTIRARRDADSAEEEIRRLDAEVEESYTIQSTHREQRRTEYGRLSHVFEAVVQALLGDDMEAHVESARRSLDLHVVRHGRRESAAITTVKLLAFDLAAVVTSIVGQGEMPRFLLHDGPREADLAPDIYERLFLYAAELEQSFGSEPPFQYIVTTTTEPPAALTSEPWVRLRLAGIQAKDRLYGMDF
jgi:hypothetical protein